MLAGVLIAEVTALQGLAVNERFVYAPVGREIRVIDASDPSEPTLVGTYTDTVLGIAVLGEVAVANGLAYVWWATGHYSKIVMHASFAQLA